MVNDCHVEKILSKLGRPGRHQVIVYCLGYATLFLAAANYVVMPSISGITPKYRCHPSSDYIFDFANNVNLSIGSLVFDPCFVSINGSASRESLQKVECRKWVYEDGPQGPVQSIVTKWNLVCQKKFYMTLSTTMFFFGVFVGAMVTGYCSDRYGRRPVMLILTFATCILVSASIFSPNVFVYIVIRFAAGFCMSGIHTTVNILCMEQTKTRNNHAITLLLTFMFFSSISLGALVGFLVQNWWKVQLLTTIPSFLAVIIGYFILPESYHWMVVHKQHRKLRRHLRIAAWINGVEVPDTNFLVDNKELIEEEISTGKQKRAYSLAKIMRFPEIRRRLLLMTTITVFSDIAFYLMAFNIREISNEPMKVLMISSAIDTIPILIALPIMKRFGKRKWALGCFIVSGVFCVVYKIYNHLVIMVIGKMMCSIGTATTFLYSCDIFPTVTRNLCFGVIVTIGRLGGVLAPQIILLGYYTAPDYPVLISGILALMCCGLIYFLPDMTNKQIPKTIEDVEKYCPSVINSKSIGSNIEEKLNPIEDLAAL